MQVNRTLIIGVGELGNLSLQKIKKQIDDYFPQAKLSLPLVQFLELNQELVVENSTADVNFSFVDSDDVVDLTQMIRQNKTGDYRIVGKLKFWGYLQKIRNEIKSKIANLTNSHYINKQLKNYNQQIAVDNIKYEAADKYDVFVICSGKEPIGSGMFLTIGTIVNELLNRSGITNSMRCLINYLSQKNTTKIEQANQYAAYKELEYALNYGYPLEKNLKEVLSLSNKQDASETIFTDVLIVDDKIKADLSKSKQRVSSVIAEFLSSYVTSNLGSRIRNFFMSKAKVIRYNTLKEKAVPLAKRKQNYGRLGVFVLKYPLDDLINYTQYYMRYQISKDIKGENLTKTKARQEVKQKAKHFLEEYLNKVRTKINLGRTIDFVSFEELTSSTFTDDWIEELIKKLTTKLKKITEQEETISTMKIIDKEEVEKLIKEQIVNSGLKGTIQLIELIQEKLKFEISEQIHYDFQSISVKDYEKTIAIIQREKDKLINEFESKYLSRKASNYQKLTDNLEKDAEKWADKQNLLKKSLTSLNIIDEDKKEISFQTQNAVRDLIIDSKQKYEEIVEVKEEIKLLCHCQQLYQYLAAKLKIAQQNLEFVEQHKQNYAAQLQQFSAVKTNNLEKLVIGSNKYQFKEFAQDLLSSIDGLNLSNSMTDLNNNFVNQLIETKLTESELNFDLVFEKYDKSIKKFREDTSIYDYLSKIEAEERKNYLQTLIKGAELKAKLARDKAQVNSVTGDDSFSMVKKIMLANDKQRVKDMLSELGISENIEVKKAVKTQNKQLKVITVETALPLWGLAELYPMQQNYFSIINQSNQPRIKRNLFHSNTKLMNIEEPLGSSCQIHTAEKANYVNLLLHLGLMKIEPIYQDSGYVLYLNEDNQYKYLTSEIKQQNRILLSEFVDDLEKNHEYFKKFTSLLLKLLVSHFLRDYATKEEKNKYYTHLQSYFIGQPDLPYVPQIVVRKLEMMLDNLLSRLKNEKTIAAVKTVQQFLNEQPKFEEKKQQTEIKLCHSQEEVYSRYKRLDLENIVLLEEMSNLDFFI